MQSKIEKRQRGFGVKRGEELQWAKEKGVAVVYREAGLESCSHDFVDEEEVVGHQVEGQESDVLLKPHKQVPGFLSESLPDQQN